MKLLIVLVLAAAIMAGCTGYATSGEDSVPTQPAGKTVEITVTAKNWEFNPNVITIKKGDHVRLTLSSTEGTHGFSLPAFNINERLVAGAEPITVEFVADKTGEFDFRCNIMCGKGHMSQKGKLIVEE
jgi:cytochrome c oxidase subunit 2